MNELSLFTGAGGGVWASKLLGHRIIGYVENNEYRQRVIAQRIRDGLFDEAPIFGDIKAFNSEGYAEAYSGLVDIVTAGFPCQPFSISGKQLGEDDPRNMWPETYRAIRTIRPRFAFLENVPGLLVSGYAGTVFGDLADGGYNARWCVLGGHETGSVSDGKRLWIFATQADCKQLEGMDFQKHLTPNPEKSCRRQYDGAIRAAVRQDDYSKIKRNLDAVARGKQRLEAIGNGQDPFLAATVWKILYGG
jgi:DNA (cytosine-5)-methyltransferase 1